MNFLFSELISDLRISAAAASVYHSCGQRSLGRKGGPTCRVRPLKRAPTRTHDHWKFAWRATLLT